MRRIRQGLAVDGAAATSAGARSGKYPLSRFLYMFTNGWPQDDVLGFLLFMQSDEGQRIVNASGFVSLRELGK